MSAQKSQKGAKPDKTMSSRLLTMKVQLSSTSTGLLEGV